MDMGLAEAPDGNFHKKSKMSERVMNHAVATIGKKKAVLLMELLCVSISRTALPNHCSQRTESKLLLVLVFAAD